MVKLSVLILTMPSRKAMFNALTDELTKQIGHLPVEVLYDDHAGNIGARRQNLLQQSQGRYVAFIDDDDTVSENYIRDILKAIRTSPDCVGMRGIMTTNGRDSKDWEISNKHTVWSTVGNKYLRHTNHLSPVKREIALSVGFPALQHGEDYAYSMGLVGKVKTEVMIEHAIYHYRFITK